MLLSFVIGLIIILVIVTSFAIYSVQTQSTSSSMRTHPKTKGGASLKVLALSLSLIYVVFFFFLVFSLVYCAYINAIVFCYWCKGTIRSRTRQSERVMNIFRTSASKPSIHIELTESGLDGGVATIGGASTRGGHAVRGGANPAADTATKGKHVVVTVEKAIEIAEGKRKRKRRKPDWKI
jgi:hypothetical protein